MPIPPASSLFQRFRVKRFVSGHVEPFVDTVATEEPLEIRVTYWFKEAAVSDSVALTMRTPGHDRELAAGFLLSEGILSERADLADLRAFGSDSSNGIIAELAKGVDLDDFRLARHTFVNSSCGVCGKESRRALMQKLPHAPAESQAFSLDATLIESLPALLHRHQEGFAQTGGLHAAALVNTEGCLEAVFEDIGRHNALDKLIGWAFLQGRTPLPNHLLFLSSRGSFELVQKAALAGAPALATVGAPSSLAIETARQLGITLIGFVRDRRFNVYSADWRISL